MPGPPSSALLVGAGGLGGPIAFALGAAGVELVIADHDTVDRTNLHRQIQFTAEDIGSAKATRLAAAVVARHGMARGVVERWPLAGFDRVDLAIDASDDPITKFALADWAVRTGHPYVIASALRYGGTVMVGAPGASCFRCLFEAPPEDAPTCAAAGVLGPVVGAIGGVAAALALGLLAGDRSHAGALFVFDDLRARDTPRIVRFARRADCPACATASTPTLNEAFDAEHSRSHRTP